MITHVTLDDLRRMRNTEGLILQGCGGPLDEWIDGINDLLTKEDILLDGSTFKDAVVFENEGLTNLLFKMDDDVRFHENIGFPHPRKRCVILDKIPYYMLY